MFNNLEKLKELKEDQQQQQFIIELRNQIDESLIQIQELNIMLNDYGMILNHLNKKKTKNMHTLRKLKTNKEILYKKITFDNLKLYKNESRANKHYRIAKIPLDEQINTIQSKNDKLSDNIHNIINIMDNLKIEIKTSFQIIESNKRCL